jgi:hypothetical protein
MRYARRFSVPTQWRAGVLPLCAAFALGCHGEVGPTGTDTTMETTPVCDASDPTNVVSPQRVALLTSTQLMNMIRVVTPDAAVGNAMAQMIIDGGFFPVVTDLTVRFPPPRVEQYKSIIDVDSLSPFNNTAQKVGDYVRDNFASVTKCTTATDACATDYLNKFAIRAYRRQLSSDEQTRFTNLYSGLKSQIVNGYQVTLTTEQATGFAVNALLMSPQLLWRWELGGAASSSPPGVYLTDGELASSLSFFLTDQPPDEALIAAAQSGSLRANIGAQVDRLLGQQTSRDWLTHIIQIYFFLNQLPSTTIDSGKFPIVGGGALYSDLEMESRLFLNDVMWNGKVMDLLTSRKAYLNTNLASMIYNVTPPAGATATNFVATNLDPKERAGMLTSAAFITTRARPTGVGIVPRGLGVKALFTCLVTPGPPDAINMPGGPVDMARSMLDSQTAQQQVAFRQNTAPCSSCHPSFDPYGLVLDWYDVVGRFRTKDDLGQPVDGHTTLPSTLGGATVQSAVELADVLSKSDVFTNCMSATMLQYALLDSAIELPLPGQKGCAAAGVAHQLRKSNNQSFTDLTRAVATSPAFALRQQIQ